jgi:hypothetical protein
MTTQLREDHGKLGSERGRHRLLGVGPARHHRFPMGGDELGEAVVEGQRELIQSTERVAQRECERAVHDVLGGRPVVHAFGYLARNPIGDRPDQAEDRVADVGRLIPECCVVARHARGGRSHCRRLFGAEDPRGGLSVCQRHLDGQRVGWRGADDRLDR